MSKFDNTGLKSLGFSSFTEAFNVIGYALGSQPASIKNYRDEFDPLFPNRRRGWHKRPMRQHCRQIYDGYNALDLADFTGLVRSFFGLGAEAGSATERFEESDGASSAFAQRLITGLAAERYFESIHSSLPIFRGLALENTTAFGCGYDFRLRTKPDGEFFAIEVKGLKGQSGTIALTEKEYAAASTMKERFFLFVVKNFCEAPSHAIFRNPIQSDLDFKRTQRMIIQTSWVTSV
ncbi:MAG TPA: DUF3883 domain-containing protein [Terracidiphilus sp.]|nr:DUF3883 domain-containing protein [Terracidiphilus sp.]